MEEQKKVCLMAFATGSESKEVEVSRLMGISAAGVLAVNPTRAEKNQILEQDFTTEEIKYVGETTVKNKEGNNETVPQIRIDILMKTDPTIACNSGMEKTFTVSFFISKAAQYSFKDGVTKIQIIDKYGRDDWATLEEARNKVIPQHLIKNGPRAGQTFTKVCADYRPAYIGEVELVKFIIALINIPRPDVWNDEKKVFDMKTDPKLLAQSEAMLDNIKSYFEGNISEVKKIVKFQPKNRVKLLLGVRTAQNGAQYQAVYTAMPLKLNVTNYKVWEDALQADKAAGRHPNVEFKVCNLMEYKTQATDYSKETPETKDDDPFANANQQTSEATEAVETVVQNLDTNVEDTDPFTM